LLGKSLKGGFSKRCEIVFVDLGFTTFPLYTCRPNFLNRDDSLESRPETTYIEACNGDGDGNAD
jgi:hypothetical protein